MRKDKKAILGMNTAQQFIVGILSLVILAVLTLVIFAALRTTIPADTQTVSFTNQSSVRIMNDSIVLDISTFIPTAIGLVDCSMSITEVVNNSGIKELLPASNYTVSGCTITPAAGAGLNKSHNNTIWNLTGSYTHTVGTKRAAVRIIDNTTNGLEQLFGNAITWFVLLGLVIIILIIGVVIGVVRGFGAEATSGGGSSRVPQL